MHAKEVTILTVLPNSALCAALCCASAKVIHAAFTDPIADCSEISVVLCHLIIDAHQMDVGIVKISAFVA